MTHVQNDVFALILHKLHYIIRIFDDLMFDVLPRRLADSGSVKMSPFISQVFNLRLPVCPSVSNIRLGLRFNSFPCFLAGRPLPVCGAGAVGSQLSNNSISNVIMVKNGGLTPKLPCFSNGLMTNEQVAV